MEEQATSLRWGQGLVGLLVLGLAGCPSNATEVTADSSDSGEDASGSTTDEDTSGSTTEPEPSDGSSSSGDPICGDGVVDDAEECDDGGESANCDDDCTAATCGDGVSNNAAGEECDDGGESAQCDADCTIALCGDGVSNGAAGEECDDRGESARCDADCTAVACGDGVSNGAAGEECDDGGESTQCDNDCTPAECGDSVSNATAGEECDGGGRNAACNVDCTLATCGDGVLNETAGEECDGGGETASCDLDCSFAGCGDGFTNAAAAEECDDGGQSQACDDDCTTVMCGDGTANAMADEECDENDLAGATCEGLGFPGGGVLACDECSLDTIGCSSAPAQPVLVLGFAPIKQFDFTWAPAGGADYYQLEERSAPGELFVQLGGDIVGESISHTMSLHFRRQASYRLRACNMAGCTDSAVVDVMNTLAGAIGYFKASNTDDLDFLGVSVSLSGDGNTLAVSAPGEGSAATGIDGDQASNAADDSGAVYVYARDGMGQWSQQAYVKASNTEPSDSFGRVVSLSDDGDVLAVSADLEDSAATGVDGDQADNATAASGAVYVFTRDGMGQWTQEAYVKASNTGFVDQFGIRMSLSGDGNTLAVGSMAEDSAATGIDGDQTDGSAGGAGAVYVFARDGMGQWFQEAYVKASNTGQGDEFGSSISLSTDGNALAVSARREGSAATGINGDQTNDMADHAGAVYVFARDGMGQWSQEAYMKASNTEQNDFFGDSISLSGDGGRLAVGAFGEDSAATGIDGDQASNAANGAGAVYVFTRDGMGHWSQEAYVKASNTDPSDIFGVVVSLSDDGNTLAVSADDEESSATGIGGNQGSNAAVFAGAVYVLTRDGMGQWSQEAYVKASNTDAVDEFGADVSLSGDGTTLAVSARLEDSAATGIGGDQASNVSPGAGAVYLY